MRGFSSKAYWDSRKTKKRTIGTKINVKTGKITSQRIINPKTGRIIEIVKKKNKNIKK